MVTGGEVILKTHSNLAFFRLTENFWHYEVEIFSGVEFLISWAAFSKISLDHSLWHEILQKFKKYHMKSQTGV